MRFNIEVSGYLSGRNGKPRLVFKKKSDPVVKVFHWYAYSLFTGDISVAMKRVDGVDQSTPWQWGGYVLQLVAPRDDDTYGPVIGSGTNAVTVDDYCLQTKIAKGTGSGQMVHGVTEVPVFTVSASEVLMLFCRPFTNSSGGDVVVNETGLYVKYEGAVYYYLLARDVLGSGVTVNDGKIFTLKYKINITT